MDTLAGGLVQLSDGAGELAANTPLLLAGDDGAGGRSPVGAMSLIPNFSGTEQGNFIKTLAESGGDEGGHAQ